MDMIMEKRVVITGLGAVTPVGCDVASFWNNLKNGCCGIATVEEFASAGFPATVAAKVRGFVPEEHGVDKAFARKQDIFAVYALAAANEALADSCLCAQGDAANIDPFRLGVYVGSGIGGFNSMVHETEKMIKDGTGEWISPSFIPCMIGNMAGAQIAIKHGAKGPNIDIVTACASSTHAIGEAFRTIRHGYADAIIAGGSEYASVPLGVWGFSNARALSRESDPSRACLPFSADRSGFVMADGAGVLVMEEYEHAVGRGAHIYAEVVGFGSTCDAYHATAPRPDGTTQAKCIEDALREAGFDSMRDVLYINAHGTGTHLNDAAETAAIKLAMGEEAARKAHISSTKSMHGHMLGASGAVEAIVSVKALEEGVIPPTIGLDNPDPECDLDYTPCKAVKAPVNVAISDSFGFGGHNACVAFRKI